MRPAHWEILKRFSLYTLVLVFVAGCGGDGVATVEPPPATHVERIEVTPGSARVAIRGTTQLQANARDAAGNLVMHISLTWSSSAPGVAAVTADGMVTALAPGTTAITVSGGGRSAFATVVVDAQFDIDAFGVPRIVTADYIDLSRIARISRFRSGVGHDYADDGEQCRSMKHYFQPFSSVNWGSVVVRSPLDGTVTEILDERTFGKQVRIVSGSNAAATVYVFHVNVDPGIAIGTPVAAGSRLGTHVSNATMSDIAVWFDTPRGRRLVSYFDAMTDTVFAQYRERGLASRGAAVISAAERNLSPLTCNGEAFADQGSIPNWIDFPATPY
jgi:hypothetical protein